MRLAERAVTNDLGKRMLRKYAAPEALTLVEALRALVRGDGLPRRRAQQLEDTALRLAVRITLLVQQRVLIWDDLRPVIRSADAWLLDLLRKHVVTRAPPHTDPADPAHERLASEAAAFERELAALIGGHATPKLVEAGRAVVGFFGDAARMQRFLTAPRHADTVEALVTSLRALYVMAGYEIRDDALTPEISTPSMATPSR